MMHTEDMLRVFQKYRDDAIVIPGRGGRHWVNVSTKPERDLPLGDPAMGGHASFALGLALARPTEKIILFDSEGDVLMGLGALTTIADKNPTNFYHFMLDNECYATTGGQPVPNAASVDYKAMAAASGYPASYAFDNLDDFTNQLKEILDQPGPVFVSLKVAPEVINEPIGKRRRWQTRTKEQVLIDFKDEFGAHA